ncbi:MAG: hypothetical protein HQM13_24005 [SAR324 cluster bacterium]|nr:hypothetical protein [SAR324 cluster bacterium]
MNSRILNTIREEFKKMPSGSRVPAIREVSKRFSISQFSVQRFFEVLKEEGLIQSFVGRGSYIAGTEQNTGEPAIRDKAARILIVCHSTPSWRGSEISEALHEKLLQIGHKPITVQYSEVDDLNDLLGKGGFDICILQPRRSILPVEVLAMLNSKARHLIVDGRQLELVEVDVILRNRAKSIALAFHHLRSLGHTHIGLLTEQISSAAGYAEIENLYLQNYGSTPNLPDPLVIRVDSAEESSTFFLNLKKAIREELSDRDVLPSAFIVSGRFHPSEIKGGFLTVGLKIPANVSVVQLRSEIRGIQGSEMFTSVGRKTKHVVNSMIDLIKWRLNNPSEPAGLLMDEITLFPGISTQCLESFSSTSFAQTEKENQINQTKL